MDKAIFNDTEFFENEREAAQVPSRVSIQAPLLKMANVSNVAMEN